MLPKAILDKSFMVVEQVLRFLYCSCSGIVSSRGLRIEACCRNQPNKNKLLLSLYTTMELKNKFKAFFSVNNIVCVAMWSLVT